MRYLKKNMLCFAGFFLFFCALFLNMGILTHAAGSKTIRAGEQLTLRAGSSSSSYRWQVSDTSVLSPGENGKQFCKISGLRAGTATVTVTYSKMEWDSSKADIWGNITGDFVTRRKTESWNVTVLAAGSSGSSDAAPVKDWPDPVTSPMGTVGEHVAGTLEDSSLNRRTNWNNQGLLAVKRNGLWGYADRNLNLVIPFQFTDAYDFEGSHFGKVKAGGQFYYINEKGEYIIRLTPGVFYNTEVKDTVIRLVAPAGMNSGASIPTEYYDCTGQRITEEEYNSAAYACSEKLAAAGGLTRYREGDTAGTWAFTRSNGDGTAVKWTMPAPAGMDASDNSSRNFREGLLVVENSEGLKGAVDKKGNFVLNCEYLLLCDSSGGWLVGRKEGQTRAEFTVVRNPLYPRVTVRGMEAASPSGNADTNFSISRLMSAASLPAAAEIQIYADRAEGLTFSSSVSADGGRTWSFIAADSAAMQTTYLIEMTEVLEGVTLDNTSLTLEKGTGHTLHAACSPAEITGTAFTWTSSAPQVASVSPEGTVSAVSKGTAVITVNCMGLTASCEVTVTEPEPGETGDSGQETEPEEETEENDSPVQKKPKDGDLVTTGKITCRIISTKKKTAEYRKTSVTSGSISIPKTVTIDGVKYKIIKIGDNALKGKKKITKVSIGSNVELIGKQAFYNCTGLKSVTFPAKLTAIGDKGFYKCTSLGSIVIPSKVNKIGKSAFYGDRKLKKITVKSTKLTNKNVGANAFKGTDSKATVRVPGKKLSSYRKLFKSKGMSGKAVYRKN